MFLATSKVQHNETESLVSLHILFLSFLLLVQCLLGHVHCSPFFRNRDRSFISFLLEGKKMETLVAMTK
jgi:hypothetical protein